MRAKTRKTGHAGIRSLVTGLTPFLRHERFFDFP